MDQAVGIAPMRPREMEMDTKWMIIVAAGLGLGLASSVAVAGEAEDVDAVRQATAKYEDISVALAEGFIPAPSGCVT